MGASGGRLDHEVVDSHLGLALGPEVLPAVPVLHMLYNAASMAEPCLAANRTGLIFWLMGLKIVGLGFMSSLLKYLKISQRNHSKQTNVPNSGNSASQHCTAHMYYLYY